MPRFPHALADNLSFARWIVFSQFLAPIAAREICTVRADHKIRAGLVALAVAVGLGMAAPASADDPPEWSTPVKPFRIAQIKQGTGAEFLASAGDTWALEHGRARGDTNYKPATPLPRRYSREKGQR